MSEALVTFEALHTKLLEADTTSVRRTIYNKMVALYNKYATIRKWYELVETARLYTKKFIRRILNALATRRYSKYDDFIDWNCTPWNGETFYLLEIRKDATNELIWSKIGTSGNIVDRIRKEVKEYTKAVGEQVRLVVNRCYVADDHGPVEAGIVVHAVLHWGEEGIVPQRGQNAKPAERHEKGPCRSRGLKTYALICPGIPWSLPRCGQRRGRKPSAPRQRGRRSRTGR